MNIEKKSSGASLTVTVSGRLDTLTAPALEQELKTFLDGVTQLVLDFKDLEYISSAGLRVLLGAHKAMKGNLIVKNANQALMEVFDITGFADILTIE